MGSLSSDVVSRLLRYLHLSHFCFRCHNLSRRGARIKSGSLFHTEVFHGAHLPLNIFFSRARILGKSFSTFRIPFCLFRKKKGTKGREYFSEHVSWIESDAPDPSTATCGRV